MWCTYPGRMALFRVHHYRRVHPGTAAPQVRHQCHTRPGVLTLHALGQWGLPDVVKDHQCSGTVAIISGQPLSLVGLRNTKAWLRVDTCMHNHTHACIEVSSLSTLRVVCVKMD